MHIIVWLGTPAFIFRATHTRKTILGPLKPCKPHTKRNPFRHLRHFHGKYKEDPVAIRRRLQGGFMHSGKLLPNAQVLGPYLTSVQFVGSVYIVLITVTDIGL